jgi:hypothetical protein
VFSFFRIFGYEAYPQQEIMADLSEDSNDNDDFDVESGDEDSEDRP